MNERVDYASIVVSAVAKIDKKANGAVLIALVALGAAVFACGMAVR